MTSSHTISVPILLAFSISLGIQQATGQPLILNAAQSPSRDRPGSSARPQERTAISASNSPQRSAQTRKAATRPAPSSVNRAAARGAAPAIAQTRSRSAPGTNRPQTDKAPPQSRARTGTVFPIFAATEAISTASPSIWNQISERLSATSKETSEEINFDLNEIRVKTLEDIDFVRAYRSPKHLAELVKTFCTNNKIFFERQILKNDREEAQKLIEEAQAQIKILEDKAKEFEKAKADEEAKRKLIREKVIGIFTDMKPEAAAQQLMAMDDSRVAIVLTSMPLGLRVKFSMK